MPRMFGDDTVCKVTILDEDFPGTIKFEDTAITVPGGGKRDYVELKILREEGADGIIKCTVKSENETDNQALGI